jgi:hypothetical protein
MTSSIHDMPSISQHHLLTATGTIFHTINKKKRSKSIGVSAELAVAKKTANKDSPQEQQQRGNGQWRIAVSHQPPLAKVGKKEKSVLFFSLLQGTHSTQTLTELSQLHSITPRKIPHTQKNLNCTENKIAIFIQLRKKIIGKKSFRIKIIPLSDLKLEVEKFTQK